MATNSKIEWTDHTVNLWWGCSKVHTGCKNCYAEYLSDVRYKKGLWGENAERRMIKSAFSDLDKYQAEAQRTGTRPKVFIGSMMDILEDSKPLQNPTNQFKTTGDLRDQLLMRIYFGQYNDLIFLFLTKRPGNIVQIMPYTADFKVSFQMIMERRNVWTGISISDQATADEYVPYFSGLRGNLFLSVEPLVGPIENLHLNYFAEDFTTIRWVIVGGESGTKRRPFELEWAQNIYEMCRTAGVPFFFKQIDKVRDKDHQKVLSTHRSFPKDLARPSHTS